MPSPGRQRGSAAAASRSSSTARGCDDDRLQEVMSRMRTALQLGLRSTSLSVSSIAFFFLFFFSLVLFVRSPGHIGPFEFLSSKIGEHLSLGTRQMCCHFDSL